MEWEDHRDLSPGANLERCQTGQWAPQGSQTSTADPGVESLRPPLQEAVGQPSQGRPGARAPLIAPATGWEAAGQVPWVLCQVLGEAQAHLPSHAGPRCRSASAE